MKIDQVFEAKGRMVQLHGDIAPGFENVAEAFKANYIEDEEIGSAVCAVVDGVKVVDLWAGKRDAAQTLDWEEDTIVCMMSVAKGLSGIAFNILIDRGLVDPEEYVAHYWPEFAVNGKEKTKVRHILDHTAGLPVVLDPLFPGAIYDCDLIVKTLEQQAPVWEPGTTAAYHIHTQGNLLGEIVRRVTGKRFKDFIRDEFLGALGLDYRIGDLTPADMARCAELVPTTEGTLFARRNSEPDSLIGKGFLQHPNESIDVTLNSLQWRTAEITSANGHGTARAVATAYGAIARGGELNGVKIMSEATIADMLTEQHNQTEQMQQRPYHQARGVLLNTPTSVWMGPNAKAFGHHGFGGSIGMGDRDAKLGFSYACNKMHTRPDNGPRARRLIEAVYAAL